MAPEKILKIPKILKLNRQHFFKSVYYICCEKQQKKYEIEYKIANIIFVAKNNRCNINRDSFLNRFSLLHLLRQIQYNYINLLRLLRKSNKYNKYNK